MERCSSRRHCIPILAQSALDDRPLMPRGFATRIAATLASVKVERDDGLLVGFSGGRDSVALSEALLTEGFENICLVHLDHCLRAGSANEAQWVEAYAEARGLGVVIERVDVKAEAQALGL